MRIAYVLSRFPKDTETFIAREIAAVRAGRQLEVAAILSLFRPDPALHPEAAELAPLVRRPSAGEAASATVAQLARHPLQLPAMLARIVAATIARPRLCLRALVTVPLACAHARTVRREGIEHLHAHFATYPALAAWIVSRLERIPFTVTVHAHDIFVDRRLMKLTLPAARAVVAISRFNLDLVASELGSASPPVELIRCGLDPRRYEFRPRTPPAAGPVRALCVASLEPYKGHADLLAALAEPGLERVELTLAGDGPLAGRLRELANEHGVAARVTFEGAVSEDRVADLLSGADLFIHPGTVAADGRMDGIPVALVEALAAGVPAVATSVSGVGELIRDGETGYLAAPGDAADLASAIARAIEAAPPLDASAGRRLVEGEYALDRTAPALARLILPPAAVPADA